MLFVCFIVDLWWSSTMVGWSECFSRFWMVRRFCRGAWWCVPALPVSMLPKIDGSSRLINGRTVTWYCLSEGKRLHLRDWLHMGQLDLGHHSIKLQYLSSHLFCQSNKSWFCREHYLNTACLGGHPKKWCRNQYISLMTLILPVWQLHTVRFRTVKYYCTL